MADTTPQNDTRAAVEAAMQQHEAAGEQAAPMSALDSSPPESAPTPAPEAPARPRDDVGRFAQTPKGDKPSAEEKKPDAPAAPAAKPEPGTQGEQKPSDPVRAGPPKNAPLPAAVREDWEKIPESTRQYILKREGEAARLMSETASARKTHAAFEKTLEPYRDLLTGEPMVVVGDLLRTAAVLKRGSPGEKAQLAAQMIAGYGIDIEALASVLEGSPLPQQAPQPYRDPRVDALEQRLAREDQQRQFEARQYAATKYKEFAESAEFLDTPGVREAMEREMMAAAQRGVAMEYQDAYDKAVWSLKDTREVLLGRERQSKPAGTVTDKAAIQRAKNAASSVKTDPVPGRVTTDNSIEALIRAQLESA